MSDTIATAYVQIEPTFEGVAGKLKSGLGGDSEAAGKEAGIAFLPSDFKKKNGYKRSIELSKEYGLYRQDYCGCSFSKAQRELEKVSATSI